MKNIVESLRPYFILLTKLKVNLKEHIQMLEMSRYGIAILFVF
jgi:hypothetical protein